MDLHRVCLFLSECRDRGDASVLVTVCAVEGSSMRNPGTIMGVCEDGSFAGSLSGGCIENAVVAEALDVLEADEPRIVRFGSGSPYLDIRLPCGGGLDLHFAPLGDADFAGQALAAIDEREPFSIAVSPRGASIRAGWQSSPYDPAIGCGTFGQWPAPRLLIIGHGAGVEALATQARTMDCEVEVLTPDERAEALIKARSLPVTRLHRTGQTELMKTDPWTAIVFLLHDHDWEIELMAHALRQPHFYLGAMGGRKAHAMRTQALMGRGFTEAEIAKIRAPIGVFHSSRDPQTLALSTLAEVVRTYQNTDFEAMLG